MWVWETKYGIRFHMTPRMRNANFINKLEILGPPQYLWNGQS